MTSNGKTPSFTRRSYRKARKRSGRKVTPAVSCDATYDVVGKIATALSGYGTHSAFLAHACSTRDAKAIVSIPFPSLNQDTQDFGADYLCYNILRKFDGHALNIDKKAAALASFLESEQRCSAYNKAGVWNYPYVAGHSLDLQVTSVLHRARTIIGRILGQLHPDLWLADCTFSSGASTHRRRKVGDAFYKLQGTLRATSRALPLLRRAIAASPLWSATKALYESTPASEVCRGSKYITVPKDWKTDRGITPEPEGNMFLQTGLGRRIRARLKRSGLDLNTQERNQHHAKLAWKLGLATIDLSQASDSVSIRICEELLPTDWFIAMMMVRSAETRLPDGTWHTLEKMSSMGNGFTFELESLLFYGISLAVCELSLSPTDTVCVYGDDIIVPQTVSSDLIRVLEACGFSINLDKSFTHGHFFESCGKHYFKGTDVTPFFIKERLDSHVTEMCRLHNRIYENMFSFELDHISQWIRDVYPSFNVPPYFPDKSGYWSGVPLNVRWRNGFWIVKCWTVTSSKHEVSSNPFGYLRSLLLGSSSPERSVQGFVRGSYWCITSDNLPVPEIGVSNTAKHRKVQRPVTVW